MTFFLIDATKDGYIGRFSEYVKPPLRGSRIIETRFHPNLGGAVREMVEKVKVGLESAAKDGDHRAFDYYEELMEKLTDLEREMVG